MKRFLLFCLAFLALSLSSALAENCPPCRTPCREQRDCRIRPSCAAVFCAARPSSAANPAPAQRPSGTNASQSSPSTGDYTTISSTAQEQKLLNLLNQDRTRNGLPALQADSELSDLARSKSQDMRDNGYFAHESPTMGSAAAMLSDSGYDYRGVGENIAHHANVEKADAAFLSSPAHRTIMMGSQWEKVGIGVVEDEQGFVYVTELFVR